jgi:hypothetical protein
MSYWKLINWWENQTWNNSFSHPGVHWIMIKECIDDNNWTGSREKKLLPLGNLQLSTLQKGLQKENEGSFFSHHSKSTSDIFESFNFFSSQLEFTQPFLSHDLWKPKVNA